jgi:hypothetical protein
MLLERLVPVVPSLLPQNGCCQAKCDMDERHNLDVLVVVSSEKDTDYLDDLYSLPRLCSGCAYSFRSDASNSNEMPAYNDFCDNQDLTNDVNWAA